MAEFINNSSKRKEVLKGVIRDLHDGKTVEEVRGQFAAVLAEAGAGEIAAVEQALISEGLPESEIKRLCDVHVAAFQAALEAQVQPDTIPGHPLHTLRAENEAVVGVLEDLKRALDVLKARPGPAELEQARAKLRRLRGYEKHYLRKENILFPILERHGFSGPSHVMWAIHDDVRAGWRALEKLLADGPDGDLNAFAAQVDGCFLPLDKTIRDMIYKEEHILFPNAMEMLTQEEWLEARGQEGTIGYAYVQPGEQWPPRVSLPEVPDLLPKEASPAAEELLHLDTGVMTVEEVNRIFQHLPVDVTYVDKDDRARFFSQTRERIFPRSPAIIGRAVQQCHPPASVHKVQQILDDFRAGRRDTADFWIQMRGMFIYIRYIALRDEQGAYQGTLEVTQEVSGIKALEGEKRLLGEE